MFPNRMFPPHMFAPRLFSRKKLAALLPSLVVAHLAGLWSPIVRLTSKYTSTNSLSGSYVDTNRLSGRIDNG